MVFAIISVIILSGCGPTIGIKNKGNNALTSGYVDGKNISDIQLTDNSLKDNSYVKNLGNKFNNPASKLSERTVYFTYDSSRIQQDFMAVVVAHAKYLLNNPNQRIVLEGHADERGTREYNIALGDQRAKSVSRIMKIHGVSSRQIKIISYGEEKPASNKSDESAWKLNRKVEIVYKS